MTKAIYVFFRLLPLFVVAPVFSLNKIPSFIRVVFCFSLALILASVIAPTNELELRWLPLAQEMLFGFALAFGFHFAFGAVHAAGALIEQQIGIASASIFDPSTHQSFGVISEVLFLFICFMFFSLNLHFDLIRFLSASFTVVPLGSFHLGSPAQLFSGLSSIFFTASSVIAPTAIVLWIIDVSSAYVSRALPQANIYFLMLPIKLFVGLIMLSLSVRFMTPKILDLYNAALLNFHPEN